MRKFSLQEAIAERRILPFSDGPKVVEKELQAAREDLEDAQKTCGQSRYKWATIQSYYAIFQRSGTERSGGFFLVFAE